MEVYGMTGIPSEIDAIKVNILSKPMRSHTSELVKYLRDIDIKWVAYKHGYNIAEIAEIFGYKKAWLYQLIKLGERFSDDILDTYKMGVLNETNVLPVEVVHQWIQTGVIAPESEAREVRELVKEYRKNMK